MTASPLAWAWLSLLIVVGLVVLGREGRKIKKRNIQKIIEDLGGAQEITLPLGEWDRKGDSANKKRRFRGVKLALHEPSNPPEEKDRKLVLYLSKKGELIVYNIADINGTYYGSDRNFGFDPDRIAESLNNVKKNYYGLLPKEFIEKARKKFDLGVNPLEQ